MCQWGNVWTGQGLPRRVVGMVFQAGSVKNANLVSSRNRETKDHSITRHCHNKHRPCGLKLKIKQCAGMEASSPRKRKRHNKIGSGKIGTQKGVF